MSAAFETRLLDEIRTLLRYARSLTRSRDAGDDLLQDTLELALRKRSMFQPGTNFGAWLATLMKNRFLDNRRQASRRAELDAEILGGWRPGVAPSQLHKIALREVTALVRQLPPDQARTLAGVVLDGLRYQDIAARDGIAIGTVRSRLFRSREVLREMAEPPELSDVAREQIMARRREMLGAQR